VRFPGDYPLVQGMSLDDAIRFAGGLETNTDLDFLLLERRIDRRGSIEVTQNTLDPQTLRANTPMALQELDRVLVFNVTQGRDALLTDTLDRLRAQANTATPTQIVSVIGNVRHPGSYPLIPGMNVERLIQVAGGLTESAETRQAEVTRYDAEPAVGREVGHVVVDLMSAGPNGQGMGLSPYDQLVVRQMPNWTERENVTIGGEVNAPGTYAITKDETMSSLIARAGGLTAYAEPRASIFLREELRRNEESLLNEYRDRLEREIITQRLQPSLAENGAAQQDNSLLGELLASISQVDFPHYLRQIRASK
jgi:protein involved in polysaccharide export with SLBB domain